jgi:hypothetical protein
LRVARAGLGYKVAGGEDAARRIAHHPRRMFQGSARGRVGIERFERALDETGKLRADLGVP